MTVERLRAAIITAIEAVAVGDTDFATEVLLSVLEEDGPSERRYHCDVCGLGLEWPGLLAEHRDQVHEVDEVMLGEQVAA